MSTCSTATSAHRGRQRRRAPPAPAACDAGVVEAVRGRLERRLVDLERDWDAYKTGRSGSDAPPRRSRSATATPSSAVTVAAAAPDGLLLALHRCSSPRTLVSSLQQAGSDGSGDDDCAAKIILSGAAAGSPAAGSYQGGFSSVCSVEGGYSVAASSTSSCPCRCAACCGCAASYSSGTGATTTPSFSPAARGTFGEHARNKNDGGRSVASRAAWISAIALVAVGLVVVAMVILELRVDEGCAEYLVPT